MAYRNHSWLCLGRSKVNSLNTQEPFFGPKQPIYPHLMQAVRITGTTIPAPSYPYASSSLLSPSLYVGFTQQLQSGIIVPRDREPCLVLDMNGNGLAAGYYT